MTIFNYTVTFDPTAEEASINSLRDMANRMTPHRKAVEAMGFKLNYVEVEHAPILDMITLRANFTCVCGTPEYLTLSMSATQIRHAPISVIEKYFDPAWLMIEQGATSPEHLRKDGYPEDVIEEIQRKGKEALVELC